MKYKPLLNAPYGIKVTLEKASGYHPVEAPKGYVFPSGIKQFFIVPSDTNPRQIIASAYLVRRLERE